MIESIGFEFLLKRSKRKTLGIEVNYKGEVIVTAPDFIPSNKIEEVLLKRKGWIVQKIEEKSSNLNILAPRQFISGESIYLFGKQYYLKIEKSNDYYVEKELHRITFYLKEYEEAPKVVGDWLHGQFEDIVKILWEKCLRSFLNQYPLTFIPEYELKSMDKRWGSCTEKGVIHLSAKLVAAPVECIEYVIFHELAHLVVPAHDKKFYVVLKTLSPDYEKLRVCLNKNVVIFHEDK